jgi:hypothetical protein
MDDTWPGNFSTIKTGFNRFCTDPVLAQAIPALVQSVTRTAFEGSRLANLYVLECLENQPANNLNLGPLDQGFFYQVFSAITVGGHGAPNQLRDFAAQQIQNHPHLATLQAVRGEYLHLRHGVGAPQPAYASRQGCSQLFNRLAKQFLTNCQNHVAVNLEQRIRGYFNYKMVKYRRYPPNAPPEVRAEWGRFDKTVRRIAVDYIYNSLAVNELTALPNWHSFVASNPRIPALLAHVSAAVCQVFWVRCSSLFTKLINQIWSNQSDRRPA